MTAGMTPDGEGDGIVVDTTGQNEKTFLGNYQLHIYSEITS